MARGFRGRSGRGSSQGLSGAGDRGTGALVRPARKGAATSGDRMEREFSATGPGGIAGAPAMAGEAARTGRSPCRSSGVLRGDRRAADQPGGAEITGGQGSLRPQQTSDHRASVRDRQAPERGAEAPLGEGDLVDDGRPGGAGLRAGGRAGSVTSPDRGSRERGSRTRLGSARRGGARGFGSIGRPRLRTWSGHGRRRGC